MGRSLKWVAALGNGGQVLCLCPELDAVTVMYSGEYNKESVWGNVMNVLDEVVAPLLIGGNAIR